jgi:inosine-uridine nucleoside N-ribohydrolase
MWLHLSKITKNPRIFSNKLRMISSKKVIIDTDSGSDDTFCIGNMIYLHKHNSCNILGITTGCGNIPAYNSFQTASKVVNKLFNVSNISVYSSPSSSILDEKCSLFYGDDGHYGKLNNICNKIYESSGTSDEFLFKCLNEVDDLTIIAIGPLTNLDLCEKKQPGILKKAKEIIIMGGAVKVAGNITVNSEYNFWINPESTKNVLKYDNIVIFPLDITHKLKFCIPNMLDKLKGHKHQKFYEEIISKIFNQNINYNEVSPYDKKIIIHDVLTALYFEDNDLFDIKKEKIVIDEKDGSINLDDNGYEIKVVYECKNYNKAQEMILKMYDI